MRPVATITAVGNEEEDICAIPTLPTAVLTIQQHLSTVLATGLAWAKGTGRDSAEYHPSTTTTSTAAGCTMLHRDFSRSGGRSLVSPVLLFASSTPHCKVGTSWMHPVGWHVKSER